MPDLPTSLWRNRPFAVLWSSYTVSLLGNGLTSAALALLAHQLVGGDASMVFGIALAIRIGGRVLASPFSPLLAEKLGQRGLLVTASVLSGLLVAVFTEVSAVWQIFVLVFALNLVDACFVPLYKSIIPGLVGTKLYPKAQALGTVSYELSNVAGPALAALAIAALGFRANFLLDALTFFAVAVAIATLREIAGKPKINTSVQNKSVQKRGALTGFRLMWGRAPLRLSLVYAWLAALAGAYVMVATISYAMGPLGLSEAGYAWIMVAFGLGSTIGALLFGWLPEKARHALFRVSPLALAAGLLGCGWGGSITLLVLGWIVTGAGYGMANVGINQLLAEHASEAERPHVFAAQFSFSHAAWGIAYPLAGWLATSLGFLPGALIFGGVILAGMIGVLLTRRA